MNTCLFKVLTRLWNCISIAMLMCIDSAFRWLQEKHRKLIKLYSYLNLDKRCNIFSWKIVKWALLAVQFELRAVYFRNNILLVVRKHSCWINRVAQVNSSIAQNPAISYKRYCSKEYSKNSKVMSNNAVYRIIASISKWNPRAWQRPAGPPLGGFRPDSVWLTCGALNTKKRPH